MEGINGQLDLCKIGMDRCAEGETGGDGKVKWIGKK